MTVEELICQQVFPWGMLDELKELHDPQSPIYSMAKGYTLGVIMGKRMECARRKRVKNNQ